jgi:hypothetical protein
MRKVEADMEAPPQDEFRRYLILSVLRAKRGLMMDLRTDLTHQHRTES